MAFSAGCLVLALIPKFRSVSLRAAVAMMATLPGVVFYQVISLPFMAALLVLGAAVTTWLGLATDPKALGILTLVLAGAFGAASFVGFVSAWRVTWRALTERSFAAGWRREFLVATWNCLRHRQRKKMGFVQKAKDNGKLLSE